MLNVVLHIYAPMRTSGSPTNACVDTTYVLHKPNQYLHGYFAGIEANDGQEEKS